MIGLARGPRLPFPIRLAQAYVCFWAVWVAVKCVLNPFARGKHLVRAWWIARPIPRLKRELAAAEAEIAGRKQAGTWSIDSTTSGSEAPTMEGKQ